MINWKLKNGEIINLVTLEKFKKLKKGTKLVCIDGTTVIKGKDEIDDDTRFGYMAYGILAPTHGG